MGIKHSKTEYQHSADLRLTMIKANKGNKEKRINFKIYITNQYYYIILTYSDIDIDIDIDI
jgi:tRNA U34 5-carboxymethylaminomethyl modifying GTPase MnmE/TrmE